MGLENAALIWHLSSRVAWPNEDARDDFIRVVTGTDPRRKALEMRLMAEDDVLRDLDQFLKGPRPQRNPKPPPLPRPAQGTVVP